MRTHHAGAGGPGGHGALRITKDRTAAGLLAAVLRLSRHLATGARDRATGGVCGGQRAPCTFKEDGFFDFFKVEKS